MLIVASTLAFVWQMSPVTAQDCNLDCLEKQIKDLEDQRKLSEAATKPLEGEVSRLVAQVQSIGWRLGQIEIELEELGKSVDEREEKLAQDYQALTERVLQFYKRNRTNSLFVAFFSSDSAAAATREITYQTAVTQQDKQAISRTTQELIQLEKDKEKLEADSVQMAALQVRLDQQSKFYQVEIAKAKDFQKQLANKIADLSKRQQEIINARSSTFQSTVGDVPLADDLASRPDYNPGFSPAFAVFSFGAPHFKGMSQYGAYGRAKEGQSAEDILRAYYGSGVEVKKDYSTDINISVEGYGNFNIEDYTQRIHEVPNSWGDNGGMEALKAQAVAARSYALARTGNGARSICATEACQVFKASAKGGNWERAVNETRGWVLLVNGQPLSTMYASTSGGYQQSYSYNGYSTPAFWDTKNGRSGWTNEAFEQIAGSPWFYKAWYKDRSGDGCGLSHPWLTGEQMADILNAWVVIAKHGQSDDRITPEASCWGGNPYSKNELRDKAGSLSTGYSSVTEVSVSYSESGLTAQLTFQTDKGSVGVSGSDFKRIFNLRAPGKISVKSGLFNIEAK